MFFIIPQNVAVSQKELLVAEVVVQALARVVGDFEARQVAVVGLLVVVLEGPEVDLEAIEEGVGVLLAGVEVEVGSEVREKRECRFVITVFFGLTCLRHVNSQYRLYSVHNRHLMRTFLMALKPLIAICGTTGVGKSRLAVELALAISGKVINADAMQVYHGLDILTNKIQPNEQRGVEHVLMNFKKPGEQYVVGEWVRDATREVWIVVRICESLST